VETQSTNPTELTPALTLPHPPFPQVDAADDAPSYIVWVWQEEDGLCGESLGGE